MSGLDILKQPEFLILANKKSYSLTRKYKLLVEQLRVKFTNIVITRARIYQLTDKKSHDSNTVNDREQTLILDIDIQRDPTIFWSVWVKYTKRRINNSVVTNDTVSRVTRDLESNISEDLTSEYLIYQSPKEGAMIISIPDGVITEFKTDYEWKAAMVSPDGDKLAILCDKKSKKAIRVFDLRHPESSPYHEYSLSDYPDIKHLNPYVSEIKWYSNDVLAVESRVEGKDKFSMNFDYHTETYKLRVKTQS